MSQPNPNNTDAVLGGQTPPPVTAAVLGGVAGERQRIAKEWGLSEESLSRFSFETVFVNENAEIIDRQQKEAFCYTIDINGVSIELVYIPAGSFMMGHDKPRQRDSPIHLVNLKSFFIGKYPVTQKQFFALMDKNPSEYTEDDRHPVETVSWGDAMEFCHRLSELTDKNFALPSESQWEYACRSGTNTPFYFGKTINSELANFAGFWKLGDSYAENDECLKGRKTSPVGIYPPNSWGVYDLHGNVWEWCLDKYHGNYIGAPSDGSAWLNSYDDNSETDNSYYYHIIRGGSWRCFSIYCMSHHRGFTHYNRNQLCHSYHNNPSDENGFRICMVLTPDDRFSIPESREVI